MAVEIHPQASVAEGAELGDGVKIAAFAVIGPHAKLGPGTWVHQGAIVTGHTQVGRDCRIHPYAVIGGPPQDLSYRDEPTRVEIGDRCTFREYVTVNAGTVKGGGVTRVGNDNLLMACSHVAHDCQVGNNVVIANAVLLAGHVHVGDYVTFGGAAAVHHFGSVGRMAMVGGMTRVVQDVPPFMTVEGNPARVHTVNLIGCKRRGIDGERLEALREAYKLLWRGTANRTEVLSALEARGDLTPEVAELVAFMRRIEGGRYGRAGEAFRTTPVTPAVPVPAAKS